MIARASQGWFLKKEEEERKKDGDKNINEHTSNLRYRLGRVIVKFFCFGFQSMSDTSVRLFSASLLSSTCRRMLCIRASSSTGDLRGETGERGGGG